MRLVFNLAGLALYIILPFVYSSRTDYAVVVDAGSTGSRAFIFKFYVENGEDKVNVTRGAKVKQGLSSYYDRTDEISLHIIPLLEDAVNVIPSTYHENTQIYIQGTAGMRLLSEEVQNEIWKTVINVVNTNNSIPFQLKMDNLGTVDGKMEAYYAVIAANFIAERIGSDLKPVAGREIIGALDMGGASTQLVFHLGSDKDKEVRPEDFWSHSWLNFGAEAVREKVWTHLMDRTEADEDEDENSALQCTKNMIEDGMRIVQNPCLFTGSSEDVVYRLPRGDVAACASPTSPPSDSDSFLPTPSVTGYRFVGTGDPFACREVLRKVLWPKGCASIPTPTPMSPSSPSSLPSSPPSSSSSSSSGNAPCPLHEDIVHPPLPESAVFYGMSVYFFALDCMRHFGFGHALTNWPKATVDELEEASMAFCEMPWSELKSMHDLNRHPTTGRSSLPHRCLEVLYITTLLEDGFGFRGTHEGISFAQEVNGFEVEWTLGFALTEISLKRRRQQSVNA